jgi:aryl-alcohol dehydrogenase-like predicted oxidoreductase
MQVHDILRIASNAGIDTLDTAIAYGESETSLGTLGVASWRIVSKLPQLPDGADARKWVPEQVRASLQRLGVPELHAILLHRPAQLFQPGGDVLLEALRSTQSAGLARKIGVSIYDPAELRPLLELGRIDIVQAPLNVLDRRIVETGWAARLHQLGVELHTRSAFLQGLLLMSDAQRPSQFSRWRAVWEQWSDWLEQSCMKPVEGCIRYALSVEEADRVVVGVDSAEQLQEILRAAEGPAPLPPVWEAPLDPALINPAHWSRP